MGGQQILNRLMHFEFYREIQFKIGVRRQSFIWSRHYCRDLAALLAKRGTALHLGKDFVVAPRVLPHKLFNVQVHWSLCLSTQASLFAPLSLRTTGVTRYHAPFKKGKCSDFPLWHKVRVTAQHTLVHNTTQWTKINRLKKAEHKALLYW